jgi:DNA modification methylase
MGLDQISNSHPTVKPITLISYLVRLITPPGGTVLDPYMGSGSGGISTLLEGFKFIGMDQDPEYFEIAKERIKNYESYREILVKQQKPKQHQYVPREEDSIKKPVISFWLNQAI